MPVAASGAAVAPAQHSASFARGQEAAPEFGLTRRGHRFGSWLGELHGRKLASALMWCRVHNRTCDRGSEPIRLGVAVSMATVPSRGAGGTPCQHETYIT